MVRSARRCHSFTKKAWSYWKGSYTSEEDASVKIPQQLEAFYRTQNPAVLTEKAALVQAAGRELAKLYNENVFPYMNVTWGTHPNHIGHQDYPGCFRCHDGDHTAKNGTAITQDSSLCMP